MTRVGVSFCVLSMALAVAGARPASAGCGCDKPAPPRAAARPFVAAANQEVTLFNPILQDGKRYDVAFEAADGTVAWSRARAKRKADIADNQQREHLPVIIPDVALGPCRLVVWRNGNLMFTVPATEFTVAAPPIALHDFNETTNRMNYRAGVGSDGTIYIPVDVSQVDGATRFWGSALDFPLEFQASNVAMYNSQGYLMQLLDPTQPGLFTIFGGDGAFSDTLAFWRHEFRTYKDAHRIDEAYDVSDDAVFHTNGTRHVDHDQIVVAIRGTFANGVTPAPGATPAFQLVVTSEVAEQ